MTLAPVALSLPGTTPATRTVGSIIADKYVLLEQVGVGSMGSVYRARHTALERDVALKLMAPEVAHDRSFAARFRREAHAASRLAHPSSVLITDFGEEPDGLLYLVMEYVRGPSLEAMLERGVRLSERRTVDILSQVLSAVAVAHEAGIVHRDLKPANVLVVETTDDDGSPADLVKVCDFGVASLRDRAEVVGPSRSAALRPGRRLTLAGAVVGTPAYMAPEQASGGTQEPRTDLYSLGVVLFEMLTGRLPLWGDTLEETMRRQISAPAPSPREFVDCTPALADVCLRAMAKRPEDRFESARAMRAALRAALAGGKPVVAPAPPEIRESLAGVAAVRDDAAERPRQRVRSARPWAVAVLAAGAVASITWLSQARPYAAAQRFITAAANPMPGAESSVASAPERAPVPARFEHAGSEPAVIPVAPTIREPPVSHRARARAAVADHGAEPTNEVVEEVAKPEEPAVVAPPAPHVTTDVERPWATRD